MKATFTFLVVISLLVQSNSFALAKESTANVHETEQCQLFQQALLIELQPKIMSALRQKYHGHYLFGNTSLMPIPNADVLEFEFLLQGEVKQSGHIEKIQLTFRQDGKHGYTVGDLKVITP